MGLLGPFNVNYPVIFRSGGDTTRVAFGKHIQEIERIYGILNAIDADKLSASDLDSKLNSFKPKLSFDDISGTLNLSRTIGNLDGSRISGKIDASKIYGNLSNATIDSGKINGLSALIKTLIPDSNGISELNKNENGYALFANGLMLQWGVHLACKKLENAGIKMYPDVAFPKNFQNKCLIVVASSHPTERDGTNTPYIPVNIVKWGVNGFEFDPQRESVVHSTILLYISYFAIGY